MFQDSNPVQTLWVEKYRPKSLDEMALQPSERTLIHSYLQQKEIPHLLFLGPPGTGKTTVAKMIIAALDSTVMSLNASKDRGIETIRDRVGTFAKTLGFSRWKIVFMDEADGLTPEAQNSLRNMMEDYHEQTRFILTANYGHKIISPIQSRCTMVAFVETPTKERVLILQQILAAEGVQADLGVILDYANRYSDLRKMIMAAEKSVRSNNGVLALDTTMVWLGDILLQHILKGEWSELVKAVSSPSFDPQKAMKDMFWQVNEVPAIKKKATWLHILATAVHESQWTPDPVVHFLGTCARLME